MEGRRAARNRGMASPDDAGAAHPLHPGYILYQLGKVPFRAKTSPAR